ncbi:MAG TPA: AAA family ATPase, partial [Gemmataceae bacterium]|nr:AAA family ATPase [Gemmataceae bacterium]
RITKCYGTLARKGDHTDSRPHRRSGILEIPERIVPVPRELLEALAAEVRSDAGPSAGPGAAGPNGRADVISRARTYLGKLPPAISGQYGHGRCFHAACILVKGFALEFDDAMPLLKEFSDRCQPPWSDHDLKHKLGDALKADGPRGYLLDGVSSGPHTAGPHSDSSPGSASNARPQGYQFDPVSSADFAAAIYDLRWLVDLVLVVGMPAVIGGPKKSLKTSLLIDLAVSLGTGTPFLGKYRVPERVPVAVVSGESGQATIKETALRVCVAKGIRLQDTSIYWDFTLPQLASPADLAALTEGLKARGIQVVIIDPLYLCLFSGAGATGLSATNLYQVGPLLRAVCDACLSAGATPILVHHTRKSSGGGRDGKWAPLDLDDLAFSGIAEFARQWIILSRREAYDPNTGVHELWLSVGGSAGQGGLWALDVDEGVMAADFRGRRWKVSVTTASEAICQEGTAKAKERLQQTRKRDKDDDERLLAQVIELAGAAGTAPYTQTRDLLGFSGARMTRAVKRLVDRGELVEAETTVGTGRNHAVGRKAKGLRRPTEDEMQARSAASMGLGGTAGTART